MNEIHIQGMEVEAVIGVPEAERAAPQRLLLNITVIPETDFSELGDEITRTVDYEAAARRILALVGERERHLIETLAAEIAGMLLREFPATQAEVEVRKFILPRTQYVAVRHIARR